MPFQPRHLTGDYQQDYVAISQILEELSKGIRNAHIHGSAAILLSKLNLVDLGEVVLAATEVTIRHGLGVAPTFLLVSPTSSLTWYESKRRDRGAVYLTASGAGSARIIVGV